MPDLTIEVPGHGTIPAYYSPARGVDGPAPGVVVIHEAFGLTDAMRAAADELAERGYNAVAPDLMSYAGNARCLMAIARSMNSGAGRRNWSASGPTSSRMSLAWIARSQASAISSYTSGIGGCWSRASNKGCRTSAVCVTSSFLPLSASFARQPASRSRAW